MWHGNSADLEITVQLLVQVDKLVQLIESPVFTCTKQIFFVCLSMNLTNEFRRPSSSTP